MLKYAPPEIARETEPYGSFSIDTVEDVPSVQQIVNGRDRKMVFDQVGRVGIEPRPREY